MFLLCQPIVLLAILPRGSTMMITGRPLGIDIYHTEWRAVKEITKLREQG